MHHRREHSLLLQLQVGHIQTQADTTVASVESTLHFTCLKKEVTGAFLLCRDQRLYKQVVSPDVQAPEALTPEGKLRFADGVVDAKHDRIITVQEDHSGSGEAVNTIAAVCEHPATCCAHLKDHMAVGLACNSCQGTEGCCGCTRWA